MRTTLARAGILTIALASLAGGCSTPLTVNGKVISGDLSFIGVVDAADPRLAQAGLADAEISLRGVNARAGQILTDGKSGKNGNFKVTIADSDAAGHPAMFHAHLPGYVDARQELAIPPSARSVLVVLKPVGGASPARER